MSVSIYYRPCAKRQPVAGNTLAASALEKLFPSGRIGQEGVPLLHAMKQVCDPVGFDCYTTLLKALETHDEILIEVLP